MSKYATTQSFGGQRASVGRAVILSRVPHDGRRGVCLVAGTIHAISSSKDMPYIAPIDRGSSGGRRDAEWQDDAMRSGDPSLRWRFCETQTEADVEAMPLGSWTWPPRV